MGKGKKEEALAADGAAPAPAPEPPKAKPKRKRKRKSRSVAMVERTAKRREAMAEALRMRRAGQTYQDIADMLEVAVSTARQYVVDAIAEIPKEEAEEVRSMMVARLDRILTPLMDSIDDNDGIPAPGVIDTILKIEERRSRLLGLDRNERKMADSYGDAMDDYGKSLAADRATVIPPPVLRPDAMIPANPIL